MSNIKSNYRHALANTDSVLIYNSGRASKALMEWLGSLNIELSIKVTQVKAGFKVEVAELDEDGICPPYDTQEYVEMADSINSLQPV